MTLIECMWSGGWNYQSDACPGAGGAPYTWAQAHALAAAAIDGWQGATIFAITDQCPAPWLANWTILRSYEEFDCSGIPVDATILQAFLAFDDTGDVGQELVLCEPPAGPMPGSGDEYDEFGSVVWGRGPVGIGGVRLIQLYNVGIAAIVKGGTTRIGFRTGNDFDDVASQGGATVALGHLHVFIAQYCTVDQVEVSSPGWSGSGAVGGAHYTAATIAFVSATKKITDSANGLAMFKTGDTITITGSGSNDGTYTVVTGNVAGEIVVSQSLVDELAGASITIARAARGASGGLGVQIVSGRTYTVVILGSGFNLATNVLFEGGVGTSGAPINVDSWVVDSNTQITAVVTVPAGVTGNVMLTVESSIDNAVVAACLIVGSPPAETPTTAAGGESYCAMYGSTGTFLGALSNWRSLTITRRVNAPATATVLLDGRDPRVPLFQLDTQIELYRANAALGISLYKEVTVLNRTIGHAWDERAQADFTATLVGLEELLTRRILLGGEDQSYGEAGVSAETIMKKVVEVQCGLFGTRAMLAVPMQGMHVETSLDRGNMWKGYEFESNMLDYLQKIGESCSMAFCVIDLAPSTFLFKAWPNPYGIDRRAPALANGRNAAGNRPVVFSEELGNCGNLRYGSVREGEGTCGVIRSQTMAQIAAAAYDSPWNHREYAVSPTTMSSPTNDLDAAAVKMAARETCEASILQTPSCAYGRDYFLGDIVSIYVALPNVMRTISKIVTAVTIKIERNEGQLDEEVSVELADVPNQYPHALQEAVANLTKRTRTLETRVTNLEIKATGE